MPFTWHFGIMYTFWTIAYSAHSTYYVASIRTVVGYSTAEASMAVTFGAIAAICFMQLWGPLSDRIERKTVIAIGTLGYAFFSIVYFFVLNNHPSLPLLYLVVALCQGCLAVSPVIIAAIADYYPAEIRGTGCEIIGIISLAGCYSWPFLLQISTAGFRYNDAYFAVFAAGAAIIAAFIAMSLLKFKKKPLS